jgi:hypothetical protein
LICHTAHLCSFFDESFHHFQLIDAPRFESAGVMENELWVACKYQLIFNIMKATLDRDDSKS